VGARGLCLSATSSLPGGVGSWLKGGSRLDREHICGLLCPELGKISYFQRDWKKSPLGDES